MTCLRSISRLAVAFMVLAGVSAAAVPAGWIALRYDPPSGADQKGHWIIVKEPADGLAAWWSDAEIARIVANDPDYVKRLETDWNPVDHPVADADEAERLTAELAQYWGGDVPQANYWAHGAMVRRGATLEAYRWTQDGLAQRTTLEQSGERPRIPAAAFDPDPVDRRYDNQTDVVSYGDRWGDHLLTATLDHVYRAELNKAKRRHDPNPPPPAEVLATAKATVQACRTESLTAEMGVFENYVRGWGGLAAKNVSFGLPANCVVDPGPPVPIVNPQTLYTACDGSKHATQAAANAVNCAPPPPSTYTACDGSIHSTLTAAKAVNCAPPPPSTYTACDGSIHSTQSAANAVNCAPPPPPRTYTACDGSIHSSQSAANAINCAPPPSRTYTACDGSVHSSQSAANAVNCAPPPPKTYTACDGSVHSTLSAANAVNCAPPPPSTYTACDGSVHSTLSAANAVNCSPPPPPITYTACDGSTHSTQSAANAVNCAPPPPITKRPCTISWLCANDPDTNDPDLDTDTNPDTTKPPTTTTPPPTTTQPPTDPPQPYTACDGSKHSTQSAADAVNCAPIDIQYFDCKGKPHDTQAEANAVSCDPPKIDRPQDDPQYTACDGTLHWSQTDADAIDCYAEETNELCKQDPFAAGCDQF